MSLFSRFFGKQPPKEGGGASEENPDQPQQPQPGHPEYMQGPPGAPMQGGPMQGPPMQGGPMQGPPMQGGPMQGGPMQGPPMQGPPMQGPPMQGAPPHAQHRVIPPGVLQASGMQPPPLEDEGGIVLPEPAVEVESTRPPSVDPRFAHWGGRPNPEYGETIPPVRDYTLEGSPAQSPPQQAPQQPPARPLGSTTQQLSPQPAPQQQTPQKEAPRRRDSPTNFHKVDPRTTAPNDPNKPHPRLHPNDALPSIIVDIPSEEAPPQRASSSHRQATQPILKSPSGQLQAAQPAQQGSQPRVPTAPSSSPSTSSQPKVIVAPSPSQPKLGAGQPASQPQTQAAAPAQPASASPSNPPNAPVVQQRSTVVMHGSLLAAQLQGAPASPSTQPVGQYLQAAQQATAAHAAAQAAAQAAAAAPPQPPTVTGNTPTPAQAEPAPARSATSSGSVPVAPPAPASAPKVAGAPPVKPYARTLVGGLVAPPDAMVAEEVSPKPSVVKQESLRSDTARLKSSTTLPAQSSPAPAPSPPSPPVRASVPPPRFPSGSPGATPQKKDDEPPAVLIARVVAVESAPPVPVAPPAPASPQPLPIPTDFLAGVEPSDPVVQTSYEDEDEDEDDEEQGDDDDAPTIVRTGTTASAVNAPEVVAARAALEKREAISRAAEAAESSPEPVTPPPMSPTPVSRADEPPPKRAPMRTELQLQDQLPPALAEATAVAQKEDREYEALKRPRASVPPALPDESEWPTATELPDPDAWGEPGKDAKRPSSIEEILSQTNDDSDDITEALVTKKGEKGLVPDPFGNPPMKKSVAPMKSAPPLPSKSAPRLPLSESSPRLPLSESSPRLPLSESAPRLPVSESAPKSPPLEEPPISAPPATEAVPRLAFPTETIIAPADAEVPPVQVPAPPKLWENTADSELLAEVERGFGSLDQFQSTPPATSAVFDDARELFTDIAATTMHHVRDFMMDLTLAPTTAEWLALCIPAVQSLRMGAEAFEMHPLVGALDEFLRALQAVSDSATPIVEGEARERLLAIYGDLANAMPKAFKLDRDRGMREGIIVRALLNQLEDVRKVQQDRLFAAGLMSLEALCAAKPRDIVETTGLSLDLATRISERFRRYKLEVSVLGAGGGENPAEWDKLREYVNALKAAHDAFEEASAKNNSRGKKDSRRARELALLDVKVMLARLGQPEALGFIERAPFADKLSHLAALIDKSEH